MNKAPLIVAGVVFAVVALLQLLRFFFQISVDVNSVPLPLWVSGIAAIVSGALSVWMFSALKNDENS